MAKWWTSSVSVISSRMPVISQKKSNRLENKWAVRSTNMHQWLMPSGKLLTKSHTTNTHHQSWKVLTRAKTRGDKLAKLETPHKLETMPHFSTKVEPQLPQVACTSQISHSTNNSNSNNWVSLTMLKTLADKLETLDKRLLTKLLRSFPTPKMLGKTFTNLHTINMDNRSWTPLTRDSWLLTKLSNCWHKSNNSNNSNNWASDLGSRRQPKKLEMSSTKVQISSTKVQMHGKTSTQAHTTTVEQEPTWMDWTRPTVSSTTTHSSNNNNSSSESCCFDWVKLSIMLDLTMCKQHPIWILKY
jgi:hypothetical protein